MSEYSIETTDKAEYIIELLKPCLKRSRNKEWKGLRYNTAWGSKSHEGLVNSIGRVIATKNEYLPKIE